MNPRFECRSDSKPRIPLSRSTYGRNSLQNENPLFKSRRSSSADRARSSVGIPRPRSHSEERKSLCNIGRSSIGLNECKIVKDPRPLSDKAYQRKKVQELIEFLNEYYNYQTTVSKLMPPSKKDFEIIFQILVTYFEQDFVVKKIEEDAPRVLKTYRYPFIPTKSAFAYVARTNWPSLLGVLLYLMDLIKYFSCIEVEMFFQSVAGETSYNHSILLKYIINSYCQHIDDEEKEAEVFTAMIRETVPYNIEELQERNKELKELMKEAQKEIKVIQELKVSSAGHDKVLKQYDDYFAKMKDHLQKKQSGNEKLAKQLAEKEAVLKELKAILDQKQATYDAQGFDGKKQLSYFEDQKRELFEKLQCKKEATKKVTSDCHDAGIRYERASDEHASVCDTFNELYSKVRENAAATFDYLNNINDPAVKNMCSKLGFEIPDCKMQVTQKSIHFGEERKRTLNEIKNKLDSATLTLNKYASKQNETLQEIVMRKSEIGVKIKVASFQETKKENDLNAEEKLVLTKVKTFEDQCEELLKKLEDVRKEKNEVELEITALREEHEEIIAVKKSKQKMLENYLKKQKQMVERHASHIKALEGRSEHYGNEICGIVSKTVKIFEE